MAQPPKNKQPEAPPQRRNWSAPVATDASLAARTAFARAGFADPTLVLRWTEIAGAETARIARPIKLTETAQGAILTLKAEPAAALFLQHESRALCGRINAYLGRDAVTKLRFVQGPLTAAGGERFQPPRTCEPKQDDPARRWRGPPELGLAVYRLARYRPAD